MSGFIQGVSREQSVLFPERLDEYVGEDNPVRVIDVYVRRSRSRYRHSKKFKRNWPKPRISKFH